MDISHIPLGSRKKDTPSLCSDLTLWEMDDIEAAEPVLQSPSSSTLPTRKPSAALLAEAFGTGSVRAPVNLSLSRALESANRPSHDLEKNPGWPFGPPRALPSQSDFTAAKTQLPTSNLPEVIRGRPIQRDYRPWRSESWSPGPLPSHVSNAFLSPPSEMSFLELYPGGNAIISYQNANGETKSITGIAVLAIEQRCPLLAAAFEPRLAGPQLHLEILNDATAMPFLRYLYTGSYAISGGNGDFYEDVPTSLLLHCQLFHLGAIYDLPALMQQANVNVIRQAEFGCSSPDIPIELVEAIKYAYDHLADHAGLLDTIISYCVACFLRHRLADDEEFKQLAYEHKPFHQALCRESMNRRFENETASAIIRMPFKQETPATYLSREDIDPSRIADVVHHFHSNDEFDERKPKNAPAAAIEKRADEKQTSPAIRALLAFRMKHEHGEGNAGIAQQPAAETDLPLVKSEQRCPTSEGMDTDAFSESDYEFVPGPATVESLGADSDTDAEMQPLIDHPTAIARDAALPVRRRSTMSPMNQNERSDSFGDASGSSESEWSLI